MKLEIKMFSFFLFFSFFFPQVTLEELWVCFVE